MVQNLLPLCLDVTDVDGYTPLDVARYNGHTEVVDYLKSLPQSFSQPGEQSWMIGCSVCVLCTLHDDPQACFVGGLKYVHVLRSAKFQVF